MIAFIEYVIDLSIKLVLSWVGLNSYFVIILLGQILGFSGLFFDFNFFLTDLIGGFMRQGVNPILTFILYIILAVLMWIFVFWMVIILYVPEIIPIPIPIIPFILPLPLKSILLEYVPPFKILTQRGILPFMRRLIFGVIFKESTIKDKFRGIFLETYGFLYGEIKNVIGEYMVYLKAEEPDSEKISKGLQDDNYKVSTIDDGTDNAEKAKETRQASSGDASDLIESELDICINSSKSFTGVGTSSTDKFMNSLNDYSKHADCYSKYLKSYVDNLT
jgi:hypothetical protein